eukprot:Lankesteria_metandrocarpae@DN3196_c1_g1_i1.p1
MAGNGMGPPMQGPGGPASFAPAARARGFRDFLSGYAGPPKARMGPYERPDVMAAGGSVGCPTGGVAADDASMEALVSRTLYLCKLPTDCSEEKIQDLADAFGDVRKITVYKSKQIAFLEYWDIRAAEKARTSLKNVNLGGRRIDCQFSRQRNDRVRDGNTGTLYVRPQTTDRGFVDPNSSEDYQTYFSAYGEIKKVSANRKREAEKFIEYYDLRSAEAALNALNGKGLQGVVLEIQYANNSSKTVNMDAKPSERRRMFSGYDDMGSGYGPHRGGGADGYGALAPAGVIARPSPYGPMSPHQAAASGAVPVDPYGYAPPPLMGMEAYWQQCLWVQQSAPHTVAAVQQAAATAAAAPRTMSAARPAPYRG